MSETRNRIVWEKSSGIGRSGWEGRTQMRFLFSIQSSVIRGEGWKLRTKLPLSIKADRDHDKDPEVLKATAERILAAFIRSLGAQFIDEETT